MEPSDFMEAMPLVDVWRFATTMSGAQCVMTSGLKPMPKWCASSWDFKQMVNMRTSNLFVMLGPMRAPQVGNIYYIFGSYAHAH